MSEAVVTESVETLTEALAEAFGHIRGAHDDTCRRCREIRTAARILIASDWMKRHDAEVRAEALRPVRELAFSEDAQAVLFGVTGTHPESYGGVTKDQALECAGEVLTNLRAALAEEGGDRG